MKNPKHVLSVTQALSRGNDTSIDYLITWIRKIILLLAEKKAQLTSYSLGTSSQLYSLGYWIPNKFFPGSSWNEYKHRTIDMLGSHTSQYPQVHPVPEKICPSSIFTNRKTTNIKPAFPEGKSHGRLEHTFTFLPIAPSPHHPKAFNSLFALSLKKYLLWLTKPCRGSFFNLTMPANCIFSVKFNSPLWKRDQFWLPFYY